MWLVRVRFDRFSVCGHPEILSQPGVCMKPTKTGIALRLLEWSCLKKAAVNIKEKNQNVADSQPCWTDVDHFNQEVAIACSGWNQLGDWGQN